jgi:glycosyltransferase involved in cell wall biosynthesis
LNSHVGWYLLGKYGRALKTKMNLWTSLYCYDFTPEGEPVGYARYARLVAHSLTGIFSDNTKFPDELSESYGIDRNLFVTTWHPAALKNNIRELDFDASSENVLWASRLDRQKRPDILLKIARQCSELKFHVYGESVMGDNAGTDFLRAASVQPNIIYHGSYSSLNEIKRFKYRGFLYTSQWDGLPNILLEIGLLGLPIISPLVGGIGDLVCDETGYPVSSCEGVLDYVAALRLIARESNSATDKIARMRELIKTRHDNDSFASVLSTYINPAQPKEID